MKADTELSVGIIGLGYWGPNLVRNFHAASLARVPICCDLDAGRCQSIARLYPGIEWTQSANEVFSNPLLDAVVIATPVSTHYDLAKAALSAGKHVLITKPLTANVFEAEELVALAEDKGLVLQVDHTFLYHPAVEKLKELIDAGELGDLYYVDSVRISLGLFQPDVSVIWDLAPHDVSIMQYLIDQPVRWVQASGACLAGQQVESMAYITMGFGSGILAHCHVNWLAPMKIRHVIVGGSRRMAVYDDNLVAEKVKIYDKGVTVTERDLLYKALVQYRSGGMYAPAIERREALACEVQHFLECIGQRSRPLTDGRAGLEVVRILAATSESLRNQGSRVSLG